ncbi:hypothetical protein [Enterobacter phage SDFMU_EhYP]|uniref:Uncharacterized protein n=1 Tax=Enterobacter phage SDFMU_EhYP TaxID=3076128 RepID=A0AA96R5U9_9CAUD|nr:hypothetical protein [Enterobacter phage SDFMU_EhYP]
MSVKKYYIHPAAFGSTKNPGYGHVPVVHADDFEKQRAKLEAAEKRCSALAAENAGLKEFVGDCAIAQGEGNWTSDAEKTVYVPATEWMPPTLSTDAFLAEVRAAAVDEVCLKISNAIINCYQDEQIGLDAAATICGDFAAQLRKGGA